MTSKALTIPAPLPEARKMFERVMIVQEIPHTSLEAALAYAAAKKSTVKYFPVGGRLQVIR